MSDLVNNDAFINSKTESQAMEILLKQNLALEREIERLLVELDEVTLGVQMKGDELILYGYLYKWRDREISFASKWGLRYFVLRKNVISYYVDENSRQPRRSIPLDNCFVKDEGTKRNGLYHIFSIYNLNSVDLACQDEVVGQDDHSFDKAETSTMMIRLSCTSEVEARIWISMLTRACNLSMMDDEQSKTSDRTEQFSKDIHHDPNQDSLSNEITVQKQMFDLSKNNVSIEVPVETWEQSDIPESSNSPQTQNPRQDSFLSKDLLNDSFKLLSPLVLKRVQSSSQVLQRSMSRLAFTPKSSKSDLLNHSLNETQNIVLNESWTHSILKNIKRLPSSLSKSFQNNTHPNFQIKKKTVHMQRSFPASKNMHLKNHVSPLSSRVNPTEISYRGFINLTIIILILTHFELILQTIMKTFLLQSHVEYELLRDIFGINLTNFYGQNYCENDSTCMKVNSWSRPQLLSSLTNWMVAILTSYGVEKVAAHGDINESLVITINFVICTLNLLVPCIWVWISKSHPLPSVIYLFQSVIIWMKLISYAHVNHDLRKIYKTQKLRSLPSLSRGNSKDFQSDLNNSPRHSKSPRQSEIYKQNLVNMFSELQDLEPPFQSYPNNITIENILYFCIAPTLCYQLNYPRKKEIEYNVIFSIIVRLVLSCSLIFIVIEEYIRPTLESSLLDMKESNIFGIFLKLLNLSIPSTYVWLLSFYVYFHLWLNLLAELTRFGDREFYKDWWNSRTIESYWRLWNLPVHHWMLRHLYYPLLRMGATKAIATICVFGFSAMFHEVVISVPFRYFALHAFFGMLAQAPLVVISKYIDKRFDNPMIGNVMFWLIFCIIGQPMGIIMYYYDIWKLTNN